MVANHNSNAFQQFPHIHFISAKEREGIVELKEMLYNNTVNIDAVSEDTIISNTRHHEALLQVQQSLHDIRSGMQQQLPGDLLSLDIRRCLYYLGEITGEVYNEDKLDYIFSKFCIGK
jgi:tRNA modification GTPase